MGDINTAASLAFRDYATDAVPSSGRHDPLKSDIRALFTTIDARIYAQPINAKSYDAVGDGVADDTAELNAAATAARSAGGWLHIPRGTYKCAGAVDFSGLKVTGEGMDQTILDFSADTAGSYPDAGCVIAKGSLTSLGAITGAVSRAGLTFAVADSSSLSQGNVVALADPTNSSWNAAQTHYRKGEFVIVDSQSAGTVTILGKDGFRDAYSTSTVAHKATTTTVNFADFSVKGLPAGHASTATIAAIKIDLAYQSSLVRVRGYNTRYGGILYTRCLSLVLDRCIGINEVAGGSNLDYGIVGGNSQDVVLRSCIGRGRRHGFTLGGGNVTAAIVNRYVRYIDCESYNHSAGPPYATDFHGNAEYCGVIGGVHHGGVQMGGDRNYLRDAVVFGNAGKVFQLSENLGPNFDVERNVFHSTSPANVSLLVTDGAFASECVRSGALRIRGNRFLVDGAPTGNFTVIEAYLNGGATTPTFMDVVIQDNEIDTSGVTSWTSANNSGGITVRRSSGNEWRKVQIEGNRLIGVGVSVTSFDEVYVVRHRGFGSRVEGILIQKANATLAVLDDVRLEDSGTTGLIVAGTSGNLLGEARLRNVYVDNSNARTGSGSSVTDANIVVNYCAVADLEGCTWGGSASDQDYSAIFGYNSTSNLTALRMKNCRDFGANRTVVYAATAELYGNRHDAAATFQAFAVTALHLVDPIFSNDWQGVGVTTLKKHGKAYQVTFSSGATTRAFNHTLDNGNLSAGNCQAGVWTVTPRGSPGSATRWWISAVSASQFTIEVDINPGADVTFDVTVQFPL